MTDDNKDQPKIIQPINSQHEISMINIDEVSLRNLLNSVKGELSRIQEMDSKEQEPLIRGLFKQIQSEKQRILELIQGNTDLYLKFKNIETGDNLIKFKDEFKQLKGVNDLCMLEDLISEIGHRGIALSMIKKSEDKKEEQQQQLRMPKPPRSNVSDLSRRSPQSYYQGSINYGSLIKHVSIVSTMIIMLAKTREHRRLAGRLETCIESKNIDLGVITIYLEDVTNMFEDILMGSSDVVIDRFEKHLEACFLECKSLIEMTDPLSLNSILQKIIKRLETK